MKKSYKGGGGIKKKLSGALKKAAKKAHKTASKQARKSASAKTDVGAAFHDARATAAKRRAMKRTSLARRLSR